MILKLINRTFELCVVLLVLFCKPVSAEQIVQFVETTGRAVINDEESINNARRNALEDAIFLAVMHGGAKINGFSSVDKETNLTDHFTVRPAGKLLDYTILEEIIDGEHYKTTIRAAVGELNAPECSARSKAKITKYGAKFDFSSKVPAWLRQIATEVEEDLGHLLQDHPNATIKDVSPIKLRIRELKNVDAAFDYTALTRGRVRIGSGNFALVSSITMQVTKSKKNIETEEFLTFDINSKLHSGDDYSVVASANYELIVKLKSQTPWRSFDILGKRTRDQIKLSIKSGLDEHILELMDKVQCIPLSAKIKLRENRLIVDLGQSHGISTNSLAVSSGTTTPYSILYVTEVLADQSVVEPLNKSLEVSSLIGKTINFMESYQ
ncbi:MAG: flagellar assembly protein T N-terminal domain-containing protein [Paracoccaceae bacterium]|nr:flagellar assembly protein T N-terminal domain-containing protein [Paracoccaceae bacterium]